MIVLRLAKVKPPLPDSGLFEPLGFGRLQCANAIKARRCASQARSSGVMAATQPAGCALYVRCRGAGSTGRRNTGVKSLCWGFKLQGLTWSFV
jgi:hypothetical protein